MDHEAHFPMMENPAPIPTGNDEQGAPALSISSVGARMDFVITKVRVVAELATSES